MTDMSFSSHMLKRLEAGDHQVYVAGEYQKKFLF